MNRICNLWLVHQCSTKEGRERREGSTEGSTEGSREGREGSREGGRKGLMEIWKGLVSKTCQGLSQPVTVEQVSKV